VDQRPFRQSSGVKLWRSLAARPEGRILIPADGWYEWMHAEQQRGGPKPAPFHHRVDHGGWYRMAVVLADADMMAAWLSTDLQLDDVPELLAPLAPDHSAGGQRLGEQRPQ
jgi:putative SOS response-associated peptidase YedK